MGAACELMGFRSGASVLMACSSASSFSPAPGPCVAFVMALGGTGGADPKSPQCWDCLQHLAMGLPVVNAQEDPSYEQGLTPGSVLPGLAQCSLDDSEIPTLRQIIKIFTDGQAD